MTINNEEGGYEPGYADEAPAGIPSGFLTIEEHAKARKVSAPLFAAVKVMQGWNAGKKVDEEEFQEAVNAFLGAPIGGR